MTGSRTIAYQHEPNGDYLGSPSGSDYIIPGKNPTLDDLELSNALQRMRYPDDPQAYESVAMRFEGAIGVSWTLTEPWFLNSHFGDPPSAGGESSAPYTYTWSYTDHLVQSSRWYVGLNHSSGAVERELRGVVFPQVELSISEGEEVRVSATGFYGDETLNSSLSSGSLVGKSAAPMVFHGGSISLPASTEIVKPQSATLSLNSGARAQREFARKPIAAVIGAAETSLTLTDIVTGTDILETAYGGSSSPSSGDVSGYADGTLEFTTAGSSSLTVDMTGVTPNTYNWSQVLNREEDATENTECHVNGVTTTAESSLSEAR